MQKTPNEFKWDLWNARIISVGFYTFVTLKWLPHFNAMKSMKKVHTDMHYSDTVLNFDNTFKDGEKHNWHCEEFSQINNSAISPPQKQTVKLYWTGVSVWIVKGSSHCIAYTLTHISLYKMYNYQTTTDHILISDCNTNLDWSHLGLKLWYILWLIAF